MRILILSQLVQSPVVVSDRVLNQNLVQSLIDKADRLEWSRDQYRNILVYYGSQLVASLVPDVVSYNQIIIKDCWIKGDTESLNLTQDLEAPPQMITSLLI